MSISVEMEAKWTFWISITFWAIFEAFGARLVCSCLYIEGFSVVFSSKSRSCFIGVFSRVLPIFGSYFHHWVFSKHILYVCRAGIMRGERQPRGKPIISHWSIFCVSKDKTFLSELIGFNTKLINILKSKNYWRAWTRC